MIIRHLYECIVMGDESLKSLLDRFVPYRFKPDEVLFDFQSNTPQSPIIYMLLQGSFKIEAPDANTDRVSTRTVGAGAVIGNLPEAGLSLAGTHIVTASEGEMVILSYADWTYLNRNRLWRGLPLPT